MCVFGILISYSKHQTYFYSSVSRKMHFTCMVFIAIYFFKKSILKSKIITFLPMPLLGRRDYGSLNLSKLRH